MRGRERQANRVQRPGAAVGLQVMFFELKSNMRQEHEGSTAYPRYYVETYPAGQEKTHPGNLKADFDRVVDVWDHTLKHFGRGRLAYGEYPPPGCHGDYGTALKYPGSPLWYIIDLPQHYEYSS